MLVKRLDLKVGFACNNNCRFCVVSNKREKGNKTTEEIKTDLKNSRDCGVSGVVFTGGEVTIRKDILELVSYAKDIGYETIQLQTNGRMLAYKTFCKKTISAGANQFCIALHGHIPELHDFLTRSPGAFNQVVQSIKNLKALGQFVTTNTVITKPNYKFLPEITRILLKYKVPQFQLAFVHADGNAWKNFDMIVPLKTLVRPYIYKSIDLASKTKTVAMVEAYPFCFMKGYERYCSERFIPPTEVKDVDYSIPNFDETRKNDGKCKGPQCKECRYDLICEGPWKEYPQKRGWNEFIPVPGQKIRSYNELV